MKKVNVYVLVAASTSLLLSSSCSKKSGDIWNDQKTSGKYKESNSSLWGNSDELSQNEALSGPASEDFIPLREEDLQTGFAEGVIPQPMETPGEKGSSLPGIDRYASASGSIASLFRSLYFNTDEHVLRGKESLQAVDKIAGYLKQHPEVYVFVEGHCDERGPEAYNLSLGARRANYIRSLLVQKGVDLNHIHTVSYGKERPLISGHGADAWTKNRRAEFKIYQKS